MPWWSWILIWTGLVLGLLAMLAWFGYALFRKAIRTADALERLGDQVAELGDRPDLPPEPRFRPAVFETRADIQLDFELTRAERLLRRQLRRDRLVARGKLLQQAPSTQRTEPHA
ncbi:hypothetical protein QMG61_02440 [Cryobacterium sp. PH31-AA6]|uniref:hypothetical protein n=1 Tax=Cryobacterium sp. PH31-AA6 TaxID=3046205 RepID=UPI0024BA0CD3|nr:hypothetical protein [Cryobacterium sp. PH31-AA6]MDJ0322623.1 hypothetical protein [Cryobacterium sp. PH31-AA6]